MNVTDLLNLQVHDVNNGKLILLIPKNNRTKMYWIYNQFNYKTNDYLRGVTENTTKAAYVVFNMCRGIVYNSDKFHDFFPNGNKRKWLDL